ncbi:MAG: hypothetical protein L0241_17235 [Planctomycetia bacterium]|nr:hypothetical protein [Planctomycetia bacterium]
MDRDASLSDSSRPLPEVIPPAEWPTVRKVAVVGLGLVAVAAGLGLVATVIGDKAPWPIHTARLFLVLIGTITVGSAISMRSDLWQVWALGSATALLAIAGAPAHWDSFRLLFGAMAAIAIAWTLAQLAPPKYRLPALSALVLFHFTGIFLATTSPPTTPWVTEQAFIRVFNPYLQFIYLRNAYHFYSPEPGPASVLVCLLKTETGSDPVTGEKQYKTQWIVLPKRPADIKDPLGLTYYRRLSLTEQVARAYPALESGADTFEKRELLTRRRNTVIPLHLQMAHTRQYRLPQPEVARYVLPSYASHVILEYVPTEELSKTTVKVYRLEHSTLQVEQFVKNADPWSPKMYLPFFLGEFDAHGNLVNPQEPLLYWLLPILERRVAPGDRNKKDYIDYLSVHALEWSPDEVLKADEKAGKVFNWSQLR